MAKNSNARIGTLFPQKVVAYLRAEKGMTLRQIATLTGTTESFISRVASGGRNLTLDHLYKIETYLKEPLPLLLLRDAAWFVS